MLSCTNILAKLKVLLTFNVSHTNKAHQINGIEHRIRDLASAAIRHQETVDFVFRGKINPLKEVTTQFDRRKSDE